jgi:hypothetical protein
MRLASVRPAGFHWREGLRRMTEPRQIYVGSLSRRHRSWGRARRRRLPPAWALVTLAALAAIGALMGPVVLPALAS